MTQELVKETLDGIASNNRASIPEETSIVVSGDTVTVTMPHGFSASGSFKAVINAVDDYLRQQSRTGNPHAAPVDPSEYDAIRASVERQYSKGHDEEARRRFGLL